MMRILLIVAMGLAAGLSLTDATTGHRLSALIEALAVPGCLWAYVMARPRRVFVDADTSYDQPANVVDLEAHRRQSSQAAATVQPAHHQVVAALRHIGGRP